MLTCKKFCFWVHLSVKSFIGSLLVAFYDTQGIRWVYSSLVPIGRHNFLQSLQTRTVITSTFNVFITDAVIEKNPEWGSLPQVCTCRDARGTINCTLVKEEKRNRGKTEARWKINGKSANELWESSCGRQESVFRWAHIIPCAFARQDCHLQIKLPPFFGIHSPSLIRQSFVTKLNFKKEDTHTHRLQVIENSSSFLY